MKKIVLSIFLAITPAIMSAQSGTNSPYSQFGLGVLSEQSTGFNRGMNGLSIAMKESNQVNYGNPASYSGMDSLTFIMDVGAALQVTNFKEGSRKINANNANFEYAVMGFRVMKNLGMSIGIMPFSNVGYNYKSTNKISESSSTTYTTSYNGSGGTRVMYIGAGWMPIRNVSIGANIGYLWGSYNRNVINNYSDENVNTIGRYYSAELNSYKLDLGLQYTLPLGKKDKVTFGATYSPGHTVAGNSKLEEVSNSINISDTTSYSHSNKLFLPTTIGAGLSWYHTTKWRVGFDYTLQKWGEREFPDFLNNEYILSKDVLTDRQKFTAGGEYVHNAMSRKYLHRVHVRAGVSYATPYIKVNGQDGPKEISASIGFGLPITNSWNNRSLLNISAQWVRNSADGLISENTFRINLGITFNERWFMKWKLE